MYFRLTAALKERFILELRGYWASHPRYQDLVENIQGKYSFKERPQHGMIIKTSSANRVDLSADNYLGVITSYVYLARVKNYPGVALEWVREDSVALQNNQGVFPSKPGVYYIELTEDTEYYVDQLLDVFQEQVLLTDPTHAMLQHPPLEGTLRLFEMPSTFQLFEGTNYTLVRDGSGLPTAEIVLTQPVTGGRYLIADYRTPGASTGPFELVPGYANNTVIPGVVLAFGRRNKKGDRVAVVVDSIRRPAALEYGGRWDVNLDVDIISRDVYAQQEIADQTVLYLWGILRPSLSTEGIEMTELSMGGEGEEPYDETGDDYFYTSNFTMTVQTDWAVHVPLNIFIRQASPLTVEQARIAASLPEDQLVSFQNNIVMLENLGLEMVSDPFFSNRNSTFEVIR